MKSGTKLVIENSASPGSLILVADDAVIYESNFQHAGELASEVARALQSIARLDEVVVGIGPGSYTGLRVGVATGFGLSLATGCRKFGCPSVLGFAETNYAVIGDARRGSIFFARIANGLVTRGPQLLPKTGLPQFLEDNAGASVFAIGPIPELPEVEIKPPSARFLLNKRASYCPLSEPIYLKEPHITSERQRTTANVNERQRTDGR